MDPDDINANNDDTIRSADDALEDTRRGNFFSPTRDEEKLEEDNDPPAAPASDVRRSKLSPNHPLHDTDEEFEDDYDEGADEATDFAERQIGPDDRAKPVDLDHED